MTAHGNDGTDTADIYVDPQMTEIIERMAKLQQERGPVGSVSPALMRERFNQDVLAWNLDPPDLPDVADRICETEAGPVPVRLYNPTGQTGAQPCLIFIHGGGWIVGDLNSNDRCLRLLALKSGVCILSVDYPLAPEHPFPAGLDACVGVLRWVRESGQKWGLDPNRLAVGGDSAGGNLALSAALDLRDANEKWLRFVLLIYAALSPESGTRSHQILGKGDFGMTSSAMEYFWTQYVADKSQRNDPRAVPLIAKMEHLPPVHLVSAGLDPLLDDSYRLASKLSSAGVPAVHMHYEGVIHGFFSMSDKVEVGATAIRDCAIALHRALAI